MFPKYKFLYPLLFLLMVAGTHRLVDARSAQGGAAAITVNTVADDLTDNGNCTLREAIEAANANTAVDHCPAGTISQPDTITFATNGIFVLTHPDGSLFVNSSLLIEGNGQSQTILDGFNRDRIFFIDDGGTVTLRHLTLQNGYTEETAYSDGMGGAIYGVSIDLVLEDVSVQDNNSAGLGGGGIFVVGGSFTLLNSTVRNNSANDTDYGGGGILVAGTTLTIDGSVISDNTADFSVGGGLVVMESTVLTITHTLIGGNTAVSGLGGGGIYLEDSRGVIEYSTVHHNSAEGSTEGGGGLLVDSADYTSFYIYSSTISANNADSSLKGGGGLKVMGQGILVWNSTISANTADNSGQGGGGVLTDTSTNSSSVFIFTTVAHNRALNANGGGIYPHDSSRAVLGYTILAYNTPNDCYNESLVFSDGYNLDGDNSCTLDGPGDIPDTDPLLGSLQNNGGPTETHALPENSPAVDAGDCQNYIIVPDQRGVARPFGSDCDMGAFEFSLPRLYLPLVVK